MTYEPTESLQDQIAVIIAEDEPMIAWDLESTLVSIGAAVIGPFPSVEDARKALETHRPQIAVLDVNLIDGEVFPLADDLHSLGVPLIFHTANYGGWDLTSRYTGAQLIRKPSMPGQLEAAVAEATKSLR